ncbi:MAG: hypothetical protein VKJ46_15985 [Leptolyngbyaceae bacterium]|nr:hypothetical protein [Leptolyngbyaceae bacterium]
MAGRKYSRIIQSARYYAAVDNYLKYITDSTKRGSRVGLGDPRPESKILYVQPFSVALAPKQLAKVSGAAPTYNTQESKMAGYTKAALAADEAAVDIDGFRAARVIIKTGITTTKKVEISKVTGMKYLSYGGKSSSIPFGRKTATENEGEAFLSLKTALAGGFTAASTKITWSKERA